MDTLEPEEDPEDAAGDDGRTGEREGKGDYFFRRLENHLNIQLKAWSHRAVARPKPRMLMIQ